MKAQSTWHYSRRDLAENYLSQLLMGIDRLAIFAERRKGKTEFLLEDLVPLAREKGFRTVYVNFWELKNNPITCIVRGVSRALERDSPKLLGRWKKEFSLQLGVFQTKLSSDPPQLREMASEALDLILKPKGGVLVMFDEIQHLATDKDYETLIATLRTFLDTNKRRVKAIFTGSSQDRLNAIFRHNKSAFYRGANLVNFPDLGEDFIHYLVAKFNSLSKGKLHKQNVLDVFEAHNCSPFLIVDLLQTMLREGIYDIKEGFIYYQRVDNPDNEFHALWASLKIIDQLILTEVIIKNLPLYNNTTYTMIGGKLGLDKITRGIVQASVNRLRNSGVIGNMGQGQWVFESTEFLTFVEGLV